MDITAARRDFHGETRSNAMHASTKDIEAKHYRKGPGKEAELSFMGHELIENRSGLVIETALTQAPGTAERKAAADMIVRHSPGARRITLGANKPFDAASLSWPVLVMAVAGIVGVRIAAVQVSCSCGTLSLTVWLERSPVWEGHQL